MAKAKESSQVQNLFYLTLLQVVLVFIITWHVAGISGTLTDLQGGEAAVAPQPQAAPSPAQPPARVDVSADDDAVKGDANAPVEIIEFSDYQCPFCTRFYQQTLPQIERDYIATGKVKFVYRDFPLGFHPEAQKAAEAAECAEDQGKYWEMHNALFDNQATLGDATYTRLAREMGLDVATFDNCMSSNKYAQEVKDDFADGQAAGVTGTPAFFVNGQLVSGAQPYSVFKQLIDAELAK